MTSPNPPFLGYLAPQISPPESICALFPRPNMSVGSFTIESMFDLLSDEELVTAADAAVIMAIRDGARFEALGAARRLAAINELRQRRQHDPDDPRQLWACDPWAAVCAEVGAEMGISQRRASGQLRLAERLQRLPAIRALLDAGVVSLRVAATIAWHTRLVLDPAAIAAIDSQIAAAAIDYGALSDDALDITIDAAIEAHDPDAVVRHQSAALQQDIQVGKPDDATGLASLFGCLDIATAELLDRTLDAVARTVCKDDPRTLGQRRVAAMSAILAKCDRLACQCGHPDCVAAGIVSRADKIVVHVLADDATIQAALQRAEAEAERRRHDAEAEVEVEAKEADETETETETELAPKTTPSTPFRAAVIVGGRVIPGPLLAELLNTGAAILAPLPNPCDAAEPRYAPSEKLRRWVKNRDLMCRFRGCNRPAEYADVDHTLPWPAGATHASDLKCLCKIHHLLKTFWVGEDGWSDIQHPDGTITWTAPTGHTYTTKPGSKLLYPDWNTTTPPPAATASSPPPETTNPGRSTKMPKRQRTRAQELATRINAEREYNAARRALDDTS